ncbi:MAG TPA: hypothetical protein VHG91_18600 [Longimicrobium sp.]|nr:hypothetical protein [Longimicrobium sp.]
MPGLRTLRRAPGAFRAASPAILESHREGDGPVTAPEVPRPYGRVDRIPAA